MKPVFYLIACRLRSRKFQNMISFTVVAVCVAVLIIALSLSNGFEKTLIDKIIIASPHVTIFGNYDAVIIPQKQLIIDNIKIAQVQALAINPRNNHVQGVLLRGTDIKSIPELFKNRHVIQVGHYPKQGEAIIGNRLADSSGLSVGDRIKVLTGPAIVTEFKISGIFKVGLYDFDSTVIVAPYNDVAVLSPQPGEGIASEVKVFNALWIKEPFYAQQFAKNILAHNSNVFVTNWQDDNKSLVGAISLEKKVIFIVLLMLVIAASVAIANSQFIQILAQQEQIAVLSAVGLTAKNILVTFILEGLLIGIVGSILGLILSLLVVFYLANYPIYLPMDVYQVETIPVQLKFYDVLLTMVSAILMVCLSSMVPAFYASKLDPVEILRRI